LRQLSVGRWPLVLLVACSGGPTAPPLAFCPSNAAPTVLQPTEYTAVNPAATDGCVVFPANTWPDTAEYLLVPQAATETPNLSSSFKLAGSAAAAAAPAVSAALQAPLPSPAEQFHARLRELERTRAYGGGSVVPLVAPLVVARAPAPPVMVGDTGHFRVLNTVTALTVDHVTAVAKVVGQHIAIFVDTGAPQPGLSSFDLDTLRAVFDTRLYAADTAAFGRESDIDGNGLVIVLLTNTVNKMVTAAQCSTGYVAGFFFGGDIDPFYRSQFNSAETFYAIVPDSMATLSCQHTTSSIKRLVPPTFVHEFQHMISYNQHVLMRGGQAEVLWLNEAMSHYAEELGGRTYLPGDSASFCRFAQRDLVNFGNYLQSPGSYALLDISGIGGLAERGEWWSFVRYMVDQRPDTSLAGANAFTRTIDQTGLLGAANLAQQTGLSFDKLVERWALANWVSDAPNFLAPPELQYKKWAFRSVYSANNACGVRSSFPLTALVSAPTGVSVSGTIRSGSGAMYQRVLQAPGASGFRVLFSDNNGNQLPVTVAPRLNVIRIR
jgi:hypothetical protein